MPILCLGIQIGPPLWSVASASVERVLRPPTSLGGTYLVGFFVEALSSRYATGITSDVPE